MLGRGKRLDVLHAVDEIAGRRDRIGAVGDDTRLDQDEQLRASLGVGVVAEQRADHGDILEYRNSRAVEVAVRADEAAERDALAALDVNRALDPALVDGGRAANARRRRLGIA